MANEYLICHPNIFIQAKSPPIYENLGVYDEKMFDICIIAGFFPDRLFLERPQSNVSLRTLPDIFNHIVQKVYLLSGFPGRRGCF